jgi:hypothetical protein
MIARAIKVIHPRFSSLHGQWTDNFAFSTVEYDAAAITGNSRLNELHTPIGFEVSLYRHLPLALRTSRRVTQNWQAPGNSS